MSFDLAFWYEKEPSDGDRAFQIYDQLTDGESDVVESSRAVDEFYAEVVSVYRDLTEENMEVSPWTSRLYHTPECVIATISWSRHKEVAFELLDLATKHGLTTYDPQNRRVHHPGGDAQP
jgi:predicted nucleic acid-binding protein